MKNSIEEDITRIKQRIEDVKEYIEYGLPYSEYLDLENSFDNILSDYKRVLKENEELKKNYNSLIDKLILIEKLQKENEELKEELETEQNERLLCYIRERQMISVQKIKGKIEDLKMSGGSDGKDNTENTARELAIEALQDILEESEDSKDGEG